MARISVAERGHQITVLKTIDLFTFGPEENNGFMKKSWAEKMNPGAKPKLVTLPKPFMRVPAGSKMLVATPEIVKDYILRIPKGETRTVKQMREELAKSYKADVTCPTSSGIFVRIASEAALEEMQDGTPIGKVTPFWRLVDPESAAAAKISCGPEFIRERRGAEAHSAR
jgi:hypothetical protein